MLQTFKRIRTDNRELEMIQDNIESAFRPIVASDIVPGLLLKDVSLKAGQDNLVAHTLARTPQIWQIVRIDAAANVYEYPNIELGGLSLTSRFINMRTSADCKVSLWVS